MNKVILIGRLTKDADLKFIPGSGKAVARFSLAVNRPMKKDEVDFINCIAFGKQAETIVQYTSKGKQFSIIGRIKTGNYKKNGVKIYTTDVIVEAFTFLSNKNNDMTEVEYDDTPFD